MNGAYILSQLRNGPSHICDISTTDGCNFHNDTPHPSLSYFHPLTRSFFLALSHSAPFSSHPCPFLSFCSRLLHVISPSCLFSIFCLFFFSPPFAILLFSCDSSLFFPLVFSYIYLSLNSDLPLLWSFSFWAVPLFLFFSFSQLALCHLLNVSTCLYLGLLSPMTPASHLGLFYLSLSLSPCSFFTHSLPLFVFPSAALLCLATSRQGCWQRWARAYLKCHWQSDKRSYGK